MAVAPMMAASMALTAAGGLVAAKGTLMGGAYARQAGDMQRSADYAKAAQLERDSGTAIGAAQQKMLERQFNTKMILSRLRARAAGSGFAATSADVVETAGAIARRGRYEAMLDLWEGQNRASGMINQAKGLRYSGDVAAIGGEMQERASKVAATATLLNTAGGLVRTYGGYQYPSGRGGYG